MFSDDWLEKEENGIVADLLFKWLARDADAPSPASRKAREFGAFWCSKCFLRYQMV